MPKFPTFPTIYDDVLTVYISKLKEWGYLAPNQFRTGTINWSTNGHQTANISIRIDTFPERPYLQLSYTNKGQSVCYKVDLVSVPSNLGKGLVWYFLCPYTLKRCRNLYLVGERFLHREAFEGGMYEKQTQSHKSRELGKLFEKAFGAEKLYEILHKKHFKTHYAGKPTKRYQKILKKIEDSKQFSQEQIELLYMI